MADIFCYDRFDVEYCSCRGSAAQHTQILLRVKLLRTRLSSVKLVLINDKTGETNHIPMEWLRLDSGYDVYEYSWNTGEYKGLIWYYFEAMNSSGERVFFGENTPSDAMRHNLPSAYQLTVYDSALKTPDWYSKGVTYHIFVDRFYRSKSSPPITDDPDFLVHADPAEVPEYLPDENGEILNRDIYGGDLRGIQDKLDYLQSLGVVTIYLSPIFEAWSNHKYNTADYMKVDSHFGGEAALRSLCRAAGERGMHVILDGVFNHTGSDSVYFNEKGRYASTGAFESQASPYRNWYTFDDSPVGYQSWWGIRTLPAVNEHDPSYRDFIMGDRDSVAEHWLKAGISGWRLDVADELPDEFLMKFHEKVRSCKPDAIIIGEVWEDASNKIAYDVRRSYFTELELDGVMNYPVKDGILDFLTNRIDAAQLKRIMQSILEHYPGQIHKCLMNLIGTHDTVRAINALACPELAGRSRDFKAHYQMDPQTKARGRQLLKMAACLQYIYPGSPSIYYGDETAMEGFEDPFNRRCYPWQAQDDDMLEHYRVLGKLKTRSTAMHDGEFTVHEADGDVLTVSRRNASECVFCAVNRGQDTHAVSLPHAGIWREIFTHSLCMCRGAGDIVEILPNSFVIWTLEK